MRRMSLFADVRVVDKGDTECVRVFNFAMCGGTGRAVTKTAAVSVRRPPKNSSASGAA